MNRNDRIQAIITFMEAGGFSDKIGPRPLPAELWPSMVVLTDGADVHRPFGFSSAQYFSYDDKWAFFYSAEVMADATAGLTDAEFADWLRFVRAHVSAHTTLNTQDEAVIDEQVFSVLPEARELVVRVHEQFFVL